MDTRLPAVARWHQLTLSVLVLLAVSSCNKTRSSDPAALDEAGVWFDSVDQLREFHMNDAEVQQLVVARQAGMGDQSCLELMRLSRGRGLPFTSGQTVAGLLSAGFRESSVLELARLNLLDSWGGEAQILRLAGISDDVILDVAHRRAAGLPVLSGAKISDLQNAGLSQNELRAMIDRGTSDSEADAYIKRKNDLAGGHGFVRQRGTRH
jgi:hypothetical protein